MIQKIVDRLYLGDDDSINHIDKNWAIIHAAKEPYHRHMVGYTSLAALPGPQYYFIEEEKELALNLIDADHYRMIPFVVVNKAIQFMYYHWINSECNILAHCNHGKSRSPSIMFLFLNFIGFFNNLSFENALNKFFEIYPAYSPRRGIGTFVSMHFEEFRNGA